MAEMMRLKRDGIEVGVLYRAEDGKARLETKNEELKRFFEDGTEMMPPKEKPPEGIVGVMVPVPVKELEFDMVLLSFETHGLIDPGQAKESKGELETPEEPSVQ